MLKGKKILITGGTGFVGSHLVEYFQSIGIDQLFVTQYSEDVSYVHSLLNKDNIVKVDLSDKSETQKLFSFIKPDYVVHLASYAVTGESFKLAEKILLNNINIQLSVLEAFKSTVPHSRMLSVGSAEAYGISVDQSELPISENHLLRPVNPYGVSKITQDMLAYTYCLNYSLDVVRVRPFNHTGVRQSSQFIVPALAERIVAVERGEATKVKVGNLEARRDISNVLDIVRAYEILLLQGRTGEVYNVGSGKSVSIQSVFDTMRSLSTATIKAEVDQSLMRPSDIADSYASIDKISALGWKPQISLQTTLEQVLQEKRNSRKV